MNWQANIAYDGGDAAGLVQYIVGYNPDTGQMELYRYDAADNDGTRTVLNGDQIDTNSSSGGC